MRRRVLFPFVLAGILIAVLLLGVAGILRPVQNGIRWLSLPVVRTFSAVGSGLGSRLRPSMERASLEEQVRDLKARLNAVSVDYVKLRAFEEENRSLRKLAKFLESSGYDHVSARIIARSPDARDATVLIDRGSRDGLETGMAVVAEDGIFVGKITSLQEHVATVVLVSDERSRLAASVAGLRELAGLIKGQGNGVAELTLIPQSVPVKRDDIIVTAGTEEKIPPNLAVGLVNEVEGRPTDPFKVASIQPMLAVSSLDLVAVLRPTALRPENERGL